MSEYDETIANLDTSAVGRGITSLDDNPDDGARALELSRNTKIPPQVVYGDLEDVDKEHRANLTANIIRSNTRIADYLRGNALADVVSNDDYGNLEGFSKSVPQSYLPESLQPYRYTTAPLIAGAKGAYKGAKEAFTEPYRDEDIDALMQSPGKRIAFHYLDLSRRVIGAIAGATFGAAEEFAAAGARAFNLDEEKARREARGIVESEMGRSGEHTPHQAAKPWIDTGREPPRGIHPEIDQIKSDLNEEVLQGLEKNLDNAQSSMTRQRSPELFQKFAEQHYNDATIAISGDRAVELYGDGRLPTPDDGLLGWVPDLEQKLEAARQTGEDVHIPLADWMTKVDPKLAKDLHDDLRVWPGGITKNEVAGNVEFNVPVDAPIAQARAASGSEPMFALGDKKLELKKGAQYFEGMDEFQFHDENGRVVGELTVVPDPATKQLYIANINGMAGLYSNSFGPSLVRSLKKQLKEMYPEYETVTGHRVSGAREKAGAVTFGSDNNSVDHPVVKLAVDDSGEFNALLTGVYSEHFGEGIYGGVIPTAEMSRHEAEVSAAIKEEIAKIAPQLEVNPVSNIFHESIDGDIKGAYIHGASPKVLVGLFSEDPIGYGRHEAIHYLKNQGLFTAEEWGALVSASKSEGWRDRYSINNRYDFLDEARQHEEAIAEAYRDWAGTRDELPHPETLVTQAFEKIRQLLENFKVRLKEIFGRDLSVDELFRKVESGEVGGREGTPSGTSMFATDDKLTSLRAEVAGLDAKTFKRLQDLIQKRHEDDRAAALKRAEKEQKTRQSKEWRENAKELRKEVDSTIRQRPDVMADLLIGSGELAGKKLKHRYPLRESDLTPEQKAALPRHYYSKEGVPIDAAARLVGFTSGDVMLEKLAAYHLDRGDLSAQEHLNKVISEETERQMEQKYGNLKQNILLDAQDQALSETNLNILAEEWQGAAMQAGIAVVDKDLAKSEALRLFAEKKIGEVDSQASMSHMLKNYRDATKALVENKPADAVVHLQRRYMNALMAAEAKKVEKELRTFDKTAKQFSKREVSSVEPEYTNFIHQILMQVGKPVRRSIEDLKKQINAGEAKNLEEFVEVKTAALREVPVWDQLFDSYWNKPVEDLTTQEFRAVHNSIKALVWNGRDERKIYRAGEAEEYRDIKAQLINSVAESVDNVIKQPKKPTLLKRYQVNHLQMETIFNRWDGYNPNGVWNQFVMRDLVDGANQVEAWKKEYAGKIKELKTPKNLDRAIDNSLFKDQDTNTDLQLTRKNLLAIMLNTGTQSNLVKLAKGYKLEPQDVMQWIHGLATKEDWDFVQGVWDIFKDVKAKSDTMYRSLSGGVAPEDVRVMPVDTPHGTYPGGYYPIIFHSEMEGKSRKLMGRDPLEQENFVRATTPAGYTKTRTGYVAPLALDLDQMPGRISSMLHDIGLRPAVLNAAKVFYDKDIRSAIRKHFGSEYKDELIPYLRAVANSSNEMSQSQAAFTRASEFIRQNIITTLVGLNPGTVLKHGPSALITSIREVGPQDFAKAVHGLFKVNHATGETNWQFAIKHSLELQRRDRNWHETLYGASSDLNPYDRYGPWRQKIIEWSSKPVAISDMLSAVPTWLAAYEKEMGNSGIHGDAVYAADRAVRRAHGSTAITSRTAIMRNSNPWLTSVYNYFSDIMNRQMETLWRAGEGIGEVKKGNYKAAMATVPLITASLFAYAIWPAIVEHLVAPGSPREEKESWAKKAAKQMAFTLSASWVGVRDVVSGLIHGRDPQFGLTGTALQEFSNIIRDFNKDHPFRKDHLGKFLQDGASFVGAATGMLPAQIGKVARYVHDVREGLEHPREAWAWLTGLRYGSTKNHTTTFKQYRKETFP